MKIGLITGITIVLMVSNLEMQSLTPNRAPVSHQTDSKLDIVFLLHANQANVPYGDYANDVCYYHVLETLLSHPELHFPLHFSGTLLTDLMWYNQSTIELIKQGYESGQFEIIGSTYAQNIPYSLRYDYDQQNQIALHREVIDEVLGADPVGFWNPERCWNQSQYVPLLNDTGYEYTFVEDQILNDSTSISGNEEFKVRLTQYNDQTVKIFNDDKGFLNLVDALAFEVGSPTSPEAIQATDNIIAYLEEIYLTDTNDEYCVVYGQDMETWGLWQEEGYLAPSDSVENTVGRLDYLLTRFAEESDWLNVITPSEFLAQLPSDYVLEDLSPIVDGQADWMQEPSQDAGYDDWFDFNANDPDLAEFRSMYSQIRTQLLATKQTISNTSPSTEKTAAQQLFHYAEYVYAANQYEFGCIGVEPDWFYRAKAALYSSKTAEYALSPPSENVILEEDWDLDGDDEVIMITNKHLLIISPIGGRIINWYNLESGTVLLANDLASTYQNLPNQRYRLGNPIDSPLPLLQEGDLWGRNTRPYFVRTNSLEDAFSDHTHDGTAYEWLTSQYDVSIIDQQVELYFDYDDVYLTKYLSFNEDTDGIDVQFAYSNAKSIEIFPEIHLTFTPDNLDLLYSGRNHIQTGVWQENNLGNFVLNNDENPLAIILTYDDFTSAQVQKQPVDALFGLRYKLDLETIPAGGSLVFSFSLDSQNTVYELPDNATLTTDTNTDTNTETTSEGGSFTIPAFPVVILFPITVLAVVYVVQKRK